MTDVIAKANEASEQGDHRTAITLLRSAIEDDANNARLWLLLGRDYSELEMWVEAEQAFGRSTELDPEVGVAWSQLAQCLDKLDRLEEAERTMLHAVHLAPTAPRYLLLARIQIRRRQQSAAIASLEKALVLEPDNDEALVNFAVQAKSSDPQAALELLRRAVQTHPDSAIAHRELGFVLIKCGNLDAAEESLRRSVELEPQDPRAAIYLANALWHQERLDEAEEEYRRACALRPSCSFPHQYYADLCDWRGRKAQAEALYREAVRLEPDDESACLHLGRFLVRNERTEEGVRWLQRAAELDVEHSYQDEIESLLREAGQ